MIPSKEDILKCIEVLNAQDVPVGNRVLRYIDDDDNLVEAKTDSQGNVVSKRIIEE